MGKISPHLQAVQKQSLVVVPKVGQYKDLPPGEYRTAGVGGPFFNGSEKKCMTALDKNGVKKTLCADEVLDTLPSNVVAVEKSNCFEEGNVDGNCGSFTWQNYFKHPRPAPVLAQRNAQNFINFFEFLGRDSDRRPKQPKTDTLVSTKPIRISDPARPSTRASRLTRARGSRAARRQALYQESFEQAMRAQSMYERLSDDGFMDDDFAVGHFGRNLYQPQRSPESAPRAWSIAPAEQRMRADLLDPTE